MWSLRLVKIVFIVKHIFAHNVLKACHFYKHYIKMGLKASKDIYINTVLVAYILN